MNDLVRMIVNSVACSNVHVGGTVRSALRLTLVCSLLLAVVECKSDSQSISNMGATCDMPGKATKGPADNHCGSDVTMVDTAICESTGMDMTASDEDAGAEDPGADFGETMYGMEGDDDDCKYHMVWSSTPLCQDGDVYFTIELTYKSDGTPVTGATPDPDITLNDSVPADTADAEAEETSDGIYRLGPVRFTQSGDWTVRFHVFDQCPDSEQSPHGHAAFYVTIP